MATTNFVDGQTLIEASWLNDVNEAVYNPASVTLPATSVTTTAISGISATDVQGVLAEIVSDSATALAGKQPLNTQLTTLAGITAQQASDIAALSTFIGTLLSAADAAATRTLIGVSEVTALSSWPVGSVYTSFDSTSPATLFGGTWEAIAGRVIVGFDAAQAEFDTVGETGGAKTHTLSTAELPAHTHSLTTLTSGGGSWSGFVYNVDAASTATATQNSNSTGSGVAHNNLQPYIVVYMWKRTA